MRAEPESVLPMRLESLAIALICDGLCVEARAFGGSYMLKVWHPDLPITGVSLFEELGEGSRGPKTALWFRASGGEWLAPCNDVPRAVDVIGVSLERCLKAARAATRGLPDAG